jgi:hypothetical protein
MTLEPRWPGFIFVANDHSATSGNQVNIAPAAAMVIRDYHGGANGL